MYVQTDTSLLVDVFENFRNMCFEIYELDTAKKKFCSWISMECSFTKTKVKLDLLTDIDMLLTIKERINEGTCHSIYHYVNANSKYIKDYDKNKESSYLQYWEANNLCSWKIPQKLPVNNFEWIKVLRHLMKISQKTIMKKMIKDIL